MIGNKICTACNITIERFAKAGTIRMEEETVTTFPLEMNFVLPTNNQKSIMLIITIKPSS